MEVIRSHLPMKMTVSTVKKFNQMNFGRLFLKTTKTITTDHYCNRSATIRSCTKLDTTLALPMHTRVAVNACPNMFSNTVIKRNTFTMKGFLDLLNAEGKIGMWFMTTPWIITRESKALPTIKSRSCAKISRTALGSRTWCIPIVRRHVHNLELLPPWLEIRTPQSTPNQCG